ncbi:DUF3871 family protein [Flavobacterium sp. NRK F10]|uniref:DUF3871 family protein n=1 Tax=Flavobacterium sp. NRK F10 TaxID=2954931 RepID=UPI0020907F94|nr:DUF3871 family protein [Flavobacterium sp. NRK F10]MCO6174443.1 DUF3871 family protein [Flavobacterium sp. NRK F10]
MEMELHTIETDVQIPAKQIIISSAGFHREAPIFKKTSPFIEANTEEVSLSKLKQDCIIPVFTKDNEITISHQEFIDSAFAGISKLFPNEVIDTPEIRTSHLIRGRTPDALHVPAKELLEHQRTMYYERMAFIIRIPSITENINGNELALTIGGVRSYNLENLYNKKTFEKFKFFIGFQNMVCCNLCVSTDGFKDEIKATSSHELSGKIMEIVQSYNIHQQIKNMNDLVDYKLTEKQFAQIIGKSRLYNYLPKSEKALLPELLMNDGHISTIAKDYYNDESFCRESNGEINLWNMYNLFTGANKSSYIDTFLDRGVNAFSFVKGISNALSDSNSNYSWFLS